MTITKLENGYQVSSLHSLGISIIDGDRGRNYPNEHELFPEGDCIFLTAKNVTEKGFRFLEVQFISDEKDAQLGKGKLVKNDLVVTTRGTVGNVALFQESDPYKKVRINSGMAIIRNSSKQICTPYLYQVLRSPFITKQIQLFSFGSAQPQLTIGIINKLRIPVPLLDEQEEISEICHVWDVIIEKAERLIAAKERHYAYELSRLISLGHHARSHVGSFAQEISERNRGGNEARVLSVTNSRGFVLPEDQFERRVASADLSNYKVVERGQYAYNPSRINVGSIARLDGWDDGVLSPMYVVFGLDDTKINSDYFLHWLDSHEARERIKNSAQGSVRETVSFTEFSAISIPLPNPDQQAAIARYLTELRREISTLGIYAERLRTQKRGLMQKLLTGIWRVRNTKGAVRS